LASIDAVTWNPLVLTSWNTELLHESHLHVIITYDVFNKNKYTHASYNNDQCFSQTRINCINVGFKCLPRISLFYIYIQTSNSVLSITLVFEDTTSLCML